MNKRLFNFYFYSALIEEHKRQIEKLYTVYIIDVIFVRYRNKYLSELFEIIFLSSIAKELKAYVFPHLIYLNKKITKNNKTVINTKTGKFPYLVFEEIQKPFFFNFVHCLYW